ncbi:exodeoxyribonuclease VII small subunit [Accumulibacter sp.]|jgi:exodeoxyribonuclease VII small subunit|uniref:exodeoxyribonuclease VII small subunit n=1 Tax=Accumulibacter sp. TaxID=2053492 RepID=UPI001AD1EF86|nr:exodeoxyribonuclease VII small subunit [Accumulibacter sp.]MBN8453525.1 exodeoxyribonuclease VII small subunit [Accumulibacter sp.]
MPRPNTEPAVGPDAAIDPTTAVGELKFELALAELEAIIANMEGGRLPLAESLAAYRRGSELLRHCQQQLADAEREIQILENGSLRAFEPGSGEAG